MIKVHEGFLSKSSIWTFSPWLHFATIGEKKNIVFDLSFHACAESHMQKKTKKTLVQPHRRLFLNKLNLNFQLKSSAMWKKQKRKKDLCMKNTEWGEWGEGRIICLVNTAKWTAVMWILSHFFFFFFKDHQISSQS